MANAFQIVEPAERSEATAPAGLGRTNDCTADPEYIRCHVMGYRKENGFVDFESSPNLVGVGCEMCHGTGETYAQDEFMSLEYEYH